MPPKYIHGVHDVNGAYLMGSRPGWICITEAIGSDPYDASGKDYTNLSAQGFSVIVRLNNGYRPAGTIPHSDKYDEFAIRCANFVAASRGIHTVIIGNEPNHENERPDGELILPTQYAKCFNLCYEQIKRINKEVEVCVAAVAPWDATTTYTGNDRGDWVKYHYDMYNSIFHADATCIHTYTHGTDPNLIYSEERMNPPFTDRYYNFLAFMDFMYSTPADFTHLPVYITETDQVTPWRNENTGWVKNAYGEIDAWNKVPGNQKIHCLCLYRSNRDDQWSFTDLTGVHEDFRGAVAMGYTISESAGTPPTNPPSTPDTAHPPLRWDERLNERGIVLTESIAAEGGWEWAVVEGKWYNEQEADGRVNAFFTLEDEGGTLAQGVPVSWYWSSGADNSKHTEIKSDPWLGHLYSIDFGMTSVAPSYGFFVADGIPSEKIWGMGLGDLERPDWKIHTAYEFRFRKRRKAGQIIPPDPTPPPIDPTPLDLLLWPVQGIITTYFGEGGPQFSQPGHAGIDIAVKQGTQILSPADGIVKYIGNDKDYGLYVRIFHPSHNFHSFFAHLSQQNVSVDQQVKRGQTIGLVGSTGNSTGPHLHYECRVGDGKGYYDLRDGYLAGRVNPLSIFSLFNGQPPSSYLK